MRISAHWRSLLDDKRARFIHTQEWIAWLLRGG
jgi:hypothetical protein